LGSYIRWGFALYGFGQKFDGGSGTQFPDKGCPPWNWDDSDDGSEWQTGDWFMHPAGYHGLRLGWAESFSTEYIFHPFGTISHLGDDLYNGNGGLTTLRHGPYLVVRNLRVLSGQRLVMDGRTVLVEPGISLVAQGSLEADAVTIRRQDCASVGVTGQGQMRLHNGGGLAFP
jgi:hypothetical protein